MTTVSPRPVILSEFGPPALACIRSWGSKGLDPGLICIRNDRAPIPHSRYLKHFCSLYPENLFNTVGADIIANFLVYSKASAIIAVNERISCWLNDIRDRLPGSLCICAPRNDVSFSLLSKSYQLKIARDIGFETLPTYFLTKDISLFKTISPEHFPICLRPDSPDSVSPGFKVRIIDSSEQLLEFFSSCSRIELPLLAQPFRNYPNLVVHGARSPAGEVMGIAAFLVERKFRGVTLTLRPHRMDNALRNRCKQFADRCNMTGSFHFEFLLDPLSNKAYFLELNCRLGGTTSKVYACGYDEPLLALASYGLIYFDDRPLQKQLVSAKHAQLKFFVYALTGRLTSLDYPNEHILKRLLKSIYAMIALKDEIFSFSDISGSLSFYKSLLFKNET